MVYCTHWNTVLKKPFVNFFKPYFWFAGRSTSSVNKTSTTSRNVDTNTRTRVCEIAARQGSALLGWRHRHSRAALTRSALADVTYITAQQWQPLLDWRDINSSAAMTPLLGWKARPWRLLLGWRHINSRAAFTRSAQLTLQYKWCCQLVTIAGWTQKHKRHERLSIYCTVVYSQLSRFILKETKKQIFIFNGVT